jgi:phage shock protein PspC (stress-responsive transcriptional regulator)
MNKTIIININGTVFHIEEQAYEMLKDYMTDVKRHFFNSADSLEITTDIENRIAEMFTEILARENRQAIIDQDVEAVIEQMGSVKDFETVDDGANTGFADSAYTPGGSRRLFRDSDDHLIGGVCAGIANYFDVQPMWVRLFFALAFVFAGTGFLVYVILWIIVPKAITRADRMAMKGEPLDLQGFKRNFEAELSSVSGHFNDLRQEARPLIYRTRDFVGDFFNHLGTFFRGAGRIIIKLLGICIILSCIAGIIAMVAGLIATWVFGEHYFSLPENFFNYHFLNQVLAAIALIVIIPLSVLIIVVSTAVFNTISLGRSAGFTLLIIWISALGVLLYHGARTAAEFRESAGFTQTLNLKPNAKQVYYLELNDAVFLTAEDSSRLDIKNKFKDVTLTDNSDDNFEPRTIRIEIEKSDVPYPILIEEFTARGRNYETALVNARNTRYNFEQQDSLLRFDTKLRRLKNGQWHSEEVRLTLRIPLNATIMVNDKMNNYISNYMDVNGCFPQGSQHSNSDMAPFVMTAQGLQCKLDSSIRGLKPDAITQEGTAGERQALTDSIITEVTPAPADTIYIDSTVTTKPARKKVIIRRYHQKRD